MCNGLYIKKGKQVLFIHTHGHYSLSTKKTKILNVVLGNIML